MTSLLVQARQLPKFLLCPFPPREPGPWHCQEQLLHLGKELAWVLEVISGLLGQEILGWRYPGNGLGEDARAPEGFVNLAP